MIRYIGSRLNYIDDILSNIRVFTHCNEKMLKEWDLYDICAGTGILSSVYSHYFKNVFSNDTSYYSYVICSMRMEFGQRTGCQNLYNYLTHSPAGTLVPFKHRMAEIADYLNAVKGVEGFITEHYTTKWTEKTRFYSIPNAMRIDGIRQELIRLHNAGITNDIEDNYLVGSLLDSADRIANVKYRYDSAVKPWHEENMIYMPYSYDMDGDQSINRDSEFKRCVSMCDVERTVLDIKKPESIIIFDPPFQRHDYVYQYGLPITIAKYDNPEVRGLYNLRQMVPASNFCRKAKYMTAVRSTIRNAFESNGAKYFFMLVPKYDNKATFNHEELEKMFNSLNCTRFEKRIASYTSAETPWRDLAEKSQLLYMYCLEK